MAETRNPKVSILLMTYNHEPYIAAALDGALSQKTDFPFEFVVADDCSTDRTTEIIRRVAREGRGTFRILPRPHNLGICRNFIDAYGQCRGEYVAILEGDDVWHNPTKLSRLVDTLDARPDCSFAFHDVRLTFEDGREEPGCCPAHVRPTLHLRDFIVNNFVPNCSALVFRNRLIDRFPDWFVKLSYYDWPLHVLHLMHGPALYLNEPLSTYRIHSGGAWHGAAMPYRLEKLLEIFDGLNGHLNYEYETLFRLNSNFWRVQAENDHLRRHIEASAARVPAIMEGPSESERELRLVLNSRSYRFARKLSGTKRWFARTFRVAAA